MKSTKTATAGRKPAAGSNGKKATSSKPSAKSSSKPSKDQSEDEASQLHKLFEDELKDIYWAEKALTKAIPKMIKKATSDELVEALEAHLEETEGHVERCEEIFSLLGKTPQAKKCEAMAGLIKEAEGIMSDTDAGSMRDAGIISAAQKVEHYEIATYGTLATFAKTLGLNEIKDILGDTLDEEKAADEKLTTVAETHINLAAARETEEVEA